MIITKLSNIGAHKASVQYLHAAVLTLDGRAYLWGKNNCHQVTIDCQVDQSSPKLFNTDSSERIVDVICGSYSSVLLTTKYTVEYIGKNVKKVTQLDSFENTAELGEMKCSNNEKPLPFLLSSKQFTYINKCPYNEYIMDCLIEEQKYLEEMLVVQSNLIKPLQKKNILGSESTLYETLCRNYIELLHFNAANVQSMLDFSNKLISECDIVMIKYIEEYLYVYKAYLNTLHSVISVGGCVTISHLVDLPQCLYKLHGSAVTKRDKNSEENLLYNILMKPFYRLDQYEKIIRSFLENCDKIQRLNEILGKWVLLKEDQEHKKVLAERTKLFWSNSGKVIEQFRSPNRRLVRESHKNPIFLQNAGRFSSHWFILLNDIFVHVNGSNSTVHDLTTIWVEPQQEETGMQYQICLKMPEENLYLYTNEPEEKIDWLHDLQTTIKDALGKASAPQPPSIRSANYNFTKNGPLKDAKYTGRWSQAKMNGSGKMEWADGKIYTGQFYSNQFHGFGRMEMPNIGKY